MSKYCLDCGNKLDPEYEECDCCPLDSCSGDEDLDCIRCGVQICSTREERINDFCETCEADLIQEEERENERKFDLRVAENWVGQTVLVKEGQGLREVSLLQLNQSIAEELEEDDDYKCECGHDVTISQCFSTCCPNSDGFCNIDHDRFDHTIHQYLIEANKILDGIGYRYEFENGWIASVVQHMGSYGGREGKWEMAAFTDRGFCSDSPFGFDPIGWLEWKEVTVNLIWMKEWAKHGEEQTEQPAQLIAPIKRIPTRKEKLEKCLTLLWKSSFAISCGVGSAALSHDVVPGIAVGGLLVILGLVKKQNADPTERGELVNESE